MPRFRIFKTHTYDKDYGRLDRSEQLRIDNIIETMFEKGDITGKPLTVPFLREKKLDGKRLIYLVYNNLSIILLVAISNKKTQQATINEILSNLEDYEDYIVSKLRENTS